MAGLAQLVQRLRRALPPPGSVSDAALLARFVSQRDEWAFEELVRRHGPMVLGVCRRVLGNPHDAEDAFQATFLVLARRAAALREPGSVGNWLYGVAHRTALAARRATARRRATERQAVPRDELPADDLADLRAALDRELARLPAKYRAVLVLADLEGKTRPEVAAELRLPEGTVASRLSRARALLAARLARHGWTLPAGLAAVAGDRIQAADLLGHAATAFAAGRAAGLVPSPTAALAERVVCAMRLDKLKLLTAMVLSVGFLGGSLTLVPGAGPAPAAPARADNAAPANAEPLQDTLLGLEKKGWEAFKKQDWDALKATVADDFLAITTDGKRLGRDELAKELAQVKLTRYAITDPKAVRLTPDAAVLTYRLKAEYVAQGMKLTEDVWVSSSWAKRAGKWVNVTYHESPAKK